MSRGCQEGANPRKMEWRAFQPKVTKEKRPRIRKELRELGLSLRPW
jgi:hypothetical protein